jgi:cytochrome c oxidase subunit 2
MEPAAYQGWLKRGDIQTSLATQGAQLFRQYGCSGCHDANATVHAPMLNGVYGKPVALRGGSTVIADERYIHDSIVMPTKQIAAGYRAIMPSFKGKISEEEILLLIAYLKSLSR